MDQLTLALAASQAENVRLRRFCDRCWDIARDGCDMDGAEIQESLVACGFLVGTKRTEACGENCRCVEYYGADEPWTCYEPATPAPVDALREVCEKVASKAWDYGFIERGALEVAGAPALTQESHAAKRAADVGPIVSSILGPEVKP